LLLQEIEAFSIKTSLYNNTDNETDDNIENSLLINHEDIIDNIEF
jgi:hypothetical protein